MTMTEDIQYRATKLAHEALELVTHHSERQRRATYVAPKYEADMSVLNQFLDGLLNETPEPPC
jgi:hypothetical protein